MDDQILQEENTICIMDATDISENEREVMKGDNVGDTTYSAKWILTTLISLSKVNYKKNYTNIINLIFHILRLNYN